ncbi:hypothetical protein D3C85_1307870 [compost metagenome]
MARREQELAVIPLGLLNVAITNQQLAHLVRQRQVMLDAGLGVLGRDEPLALRQADVGPACLPGFADARAVTEHHQRQHGVGRGSQHDVGQLLQQPRQLNTAQPGWLGTHLGLGEVAELDPRHRVGRYQAELERLAHRLDQKLEHQLHKASGVAFLQRPHQLAVERGLVDIAER